MPQPNPLRPPSLRLPPSRIAGALVSAVLLLAASAGEGIGQDAEEPLQLIPPQQSEADDLIGAAPSETAPAPVPDQAAVPAAGGEESGVSAAPADTPAATPDDGGIVVHTLEAFDPDATGLSLPEITAFPADIWSGSRRTRIDALLPRVPVLATSAAMRRLALALLISPAQPPGGPGEPGAFVLSRAERLAAMGERGHALSLLERAAPPGGADAVARLRTDHRLAALDYSGACAGIAGKASRSSDGYWRRLRILCQAEAGLIEAAMLGLELLRESGAPPDPLFDDTIYAMAGLAEPTPERFDQPTPLHVAAWRLAQIPVPAEAVATAAPDLLPAIADAPESSPETQLLAAERAWAAGLLPVEAVRDLYLRMAFTQDERIDVLHTVQELEAPLARALMLQEIEAQTAPALRAELLAAALSFAETHGGYALMARALVHQAAAIPQEPAHGWFGGTAGRALIAAGQRETAQAWYALASELAPRDAEAARGALQLWPLMLLSSDGARLASADFAAWLGLQADEAGVDRAFALACWLVILHDALGGQIDPEVWDRVLADEQPLPTRPAVPVLAHLLRTAAEGEGVGETVLMALVHLGSGGPGAADLAVVGPVVSSLVSVGFREEARALALEAALAAGL